MVYTERTERYISPQEQSNAARNNGNGNSSNDKSNVATSKYGSQNAGCNGGGVGKQSVQEDKWKYNNMVRNEREKFNSLHFC